MPLRIAGFKEEFVAFTGALSTASETAEGDENYGHTGLLRERDLVDGITYEMTRPRNSKDAGERPFMERDATEPV